MLDRRAFIVFAGGLAVAAGFRSWSIVLPKRPQALEVDWDQSSGGVWIQSPGQCPLIVDGVRLVLGDRLAISLGCGGLASRGVYEVARTGLRRARG